MNMAPIERQSLHDAVTARIRDMIVDGAYLPGSRLPERVLCETLGISRTPLREALKVLASEGLLEIAPNRGARVAGLTADDVDEQGFGTNGDALSFSPAMSVAECIHVPRRAS